MKKKIHPALILHPSCVAENVGINQKWYFYKKKKVSGVLKKQAQYAQAYDRASMYVQNGSTRNSHPLSGKQLKKLQGPQGELSVPGDHNEAW